MGDWTKEPWRNMNGFGIICGNYDAAILREPMVCRSPDQHSINDNNFDRIVACVNAMQGISAPAAFVAAVRYAFQQAFIGPELNMSNYTHDEVGELNARMTDIYLTLKPHVEALAAKPTDPPKEATL